MRASKRTREAPLEEMEMDGVLGLDVSVVSKVSIGSEGGVLARSIARSPDIITLNVGR